MNRAGLDELEECGFRFESGSVSALHFEATGHRTEGGRKRAARGVLERLSGLEDWLLADHSGPVNFFGMTRAVDDRPMPVQQLDGDVAFVRDLNRVEKKPTTARWAAVFRRITCAHANAYAGCFGFGGRFEEIAFGHGPDSSRHQPIDRVAIGR